MTMELLGIWSYNTYHKAYEDLVLRWFIKEIQKSKNQYSARVIAISKTDKATNKALDKATIKATDETTDIIDKQITINNKQIEKEWFDLFWKEFPHARKSDKTKTKEYYNKCSGTEDEIMKEIKYMRWCIDYQFIDWKYIPACERWIRDFVATNETIRNQNIKNIVYKIREKNLDKDEDIATRLINDFGKDVIMKYSREYHNEYKWVKLKLS